MTDSRRVHVNRWWTDGQTIGKRERQMRGVKRDLIWTSKSPREPREISLIQVNPEADNPRRNVQIWMRVIDFFIEGIGAGDAGITHPAPRRDLFQIRASLDCSFHMGGLDGGLWWYSTWNIYCPASLQTTDYKHPKSSFFFVYDSI